LQGNNPGSGLRPEREPDGLSSEMQSIGSDSGYVTQFFDWQILGDDVAT